MNIKRIVVLIRSYHTDEVFIDTDLPSPFPLEIQKEDLTIKFEVQKGQGIEYVRRHFNIEPEVLDLDKV